MKPIQFNTTVYKSKEGNILQQSCLFKFQHIITSTKVEIIFSRVYLHMIKNGKIIPRGCIQDFLQLPLDEPLQLHLLRSVYKSRRGCIPDGVDEGLEGQLDAILGGDDGVVVDERVPRHRWIVRVDGKRRAVLEKAPDRVISPAYGAEERLMVHYGRK